VCVSTLTMTEEKKKRQSLKFKRVFKPKDTYCFVVFTDESNWRRFLSSPPLAPPTTRSSRGGSWLTRGAPTEMYSSESMEDGRGREGIDSFFFFLLNLYRGFIAVLKYVRSYLHSLGLVTETNKIIYCCLVYTLSH